MALKVHRLPDEHKLSCFLGRLKNEIWLLVRIFNPKTLVEAYSLPRIQEECLSNLAKGLRPPWRSTPFSSSNRSMSYELTIGEGKGPPVRANPLSPNRSNANFLRRQGINQNKAPNPNQALVPVQRVTQAQIRGPSQKRPLLLLWR